MSCEIEIRPVAVEQTYPLRHHILWPEQPLSFVQLPEDSAGHHFGAFTTSTDHPVFVGVISLYMTDSTARFRKMCVLPSHQSQGIGSRLVDHVIRASTEAGMSSVWCDARLSALPFYRRLGLQAEGNPFDKSGIQYLVMRRRLP
jgi:GNAT superfamily N-acetyltransferase